MPKTGGNLEKQGGKKHFRETEGKCTETAKTGRTKKRSSEILADESQEIFQEKVKLSKFFRQSKIFLK